MRLFRDLWQRVHEPRIISAITALIYFVLMSAGLYSLANPPSSIEGEIGTLAMRILAGTLAVGGAIGAPTALTGIWWLERTAVLCIALSAAIYLMITVVLHVTSPSGNRLLQAAFIFTVLAMQAVRWHRIRERPYDPTRSTPGSAD